MNDVDETRCNAEAQTVDERNMTDGFCPEADDPDAWLEDGDSPAPGRMIEGEQSRKRTRRRGLLLALTALAVLAGAVVVAWCRTVLDDGSGITEAEHD